MATDIVRLFEKRVQVLFPGLRILRKSDSRWYRFLGWLLKPVMPDYMTRYNALGMNGNIYIAEDGSTPNIDTIAVLCHDLVHLADRKKYGILPYMAAYLFPQCLSILSLLSIFGGSWLWFLTALVFLLPIPAPGRANIETRGYIMSLYVYRLFRDKKYADRHVNSIVDMFVGRSYYYMWPFNRKKQEEYFKNHVVGIIQIMNDPIYRFVTEFVREVKDAGL